MRFLGYGPADRQVAVAVLQRAQEIRAKREQEMADYTATRSSGLTAQAITRWFARALPKLIEPFLRDPHN